MATIPGQRGPGTTTIEAPARDWLKFENIDQFNDAYIDEIANGMVRRWQLMKGATEAEIRGAADAKETGYRENFVKFWKARGMTDVDQTSADNAWRKVRAKAAQEYYKRRMQLSAPPLPSRAEEVIEVEPIPDDEHEGLSAELNAFCSSQEWISAKLDSDTLGRFNAGFAPLLADILKKIPDEAAQEHVIEAARAKYASTLLPMYLKSNEEYPPDQLAETFKKWVESAWPSIELSARLH